MTLIQITNGTNTVEFAVDEDYGLLGWPLSIAPRRRSRLSERSPYELVREQLTVFIGGSTPQVAQQNLLKLIDLLEDSQKFADGDTTVSPVRLVYQPNGITSATYECLVLGNENNPMVVLPREYVNSGVLSVVDGLTVTFLREGLWVDNNDESAVANVDPSETTVQTVTFAGGATNAESPIDFAFNVTDGVHHTGYMVIGDDIDIQHNGTPASIVAATSWQSLGSGVSLTMAQGLPVRLFVKVRNNSSLASWKLAFRDSQQNFRTGIVNVPAGSTGVQVIAFPPKVNLGADSSTWNPVAISDINDVSETLELRSILMAVGDVHTFFFDWDAPNSIGSSVQCILENRILTFPSPAARVGDYGIASTGANIYSSKASFKLAFIARSSNTTWDFSAVSSSLAATRFRGTLLPT